MKESKIELTFKCPVKWSSMGAAADGRYCSACERTVKDFTKSSAEEICSSLEGTSDACGSFYATQLNKPFGDWRDKLITYYQGITKPSSPKRFALLFITALLFLSGCRSRRLGGYASINERWDYKGSNGNAY